ncbi:MAG: hypothetical protein ABI158_15560 [Edaphobacter sp.]
MAIDDPASSGDSKRPWEQRLHQAGARIEEDLQRFVKYLNDEIVPDVRRNGSDALRSAAAELNRLAQRMDDRSHSAPPPPGEPKP